MVGERALHELDHLNYQVPNAEDPVRVYPAQTEGTLTGRHGAGWRPGVISLREHPQDSLGADIFLRHELMHEASHRTCGGKLPIWAEEAYAMRFSGELASPTYMSPPAESELKGLRGTVRSGAMLSVYDYQTLARLTLTASFPDAPCTIPVGLAKVLGTAFEGGAKDASHILANVLTGRVLAASGDMTSRYPPGSLLKIPYAASLSAGDLTGIGLELAESDTDGLLARKNAFSLERYRLLIAGIKESSLLSPLTHEELLARGDDYPRRYVGGRSEDGGFAFEASLPELVMVLRSSLLSQPGRFVGLSENGSIKGSTLYEESEEDKAVLKKNKVLAKTGSIRDSRGLPLMGHLLFAWPAEDPLYIAIFRQGGVPGSSLLHRAAPLLKEWAERYPVASGRVRVRLLAKLDRASWEVVEECPGLMTGFDGGWRGQVSTCGNFHIMAKARGSRPERMVSGVLHFAPDSDAVVLETDPESYADAVLAAEAQELRGPARQALRAVIVWNGIHGGARHPESNSVCDTTHCMVFQGGREATSGRPLAATDFGLLRILDDIAQEHHLDWLPFSKGGDERWERTFSAGALGAQLQETRILDIRRERKRDGKIVIHLLYPESEEVIPCEIFRNTMKLPSCPDAIQHRASEGFWTFQGIGEGHGEGFSLSRAQALSSANHEAVSIIKDAYDAQRN